MGEMRDSDWSRQILLRSDWLGPSVATMTTQVRSALKKLQERHSLSSSIKNEQVSTYSINSEKIN